MVLWLIILLLVLTNISKISADADAEYSFY